MTADGSRFVLTVLMALCAGTFPAQAQTKDASTRSVASSLIQEGDSTASLDARWKQLEREYAALRDRVHARLASTRPAALSSFDQAEAAWKRYVGLECDDVPFALYQGGTAVPNLGLRCKTSLMTERLAYLRREFAPFFH